MRTKNLSEISSVFPELYEDLIIQSGDKNNSDLEKHALAKFSPASSLNISPKEGDLTQIVVVRKNDNGESLDLNTLDISLNLDNPSDHVIHSLLKSHKTKIFHVAIDSSGSYAKIRDPRNLDKQAKIGLENISGALSGELSLFSSIDEKKYDITSEGHQDQNDPNHFDWYWVRSKEGGKEWNLTIRNGELSLADHKKIMTQKQDMQEFSRAPERLQSQTLQRRIRSIPLHMMIGALQIPIYCLTRLSNVLENVTVSTEASSQNPLTTTMGLAVAGSSWQPNPAAARTNLRYADLGDGARRGVFEMERGRLCLVRELRPGEQHPPQLSPEEFSQLTEEQQNQRLVGSEMRFADNQQRFPPDGQIHPQAGQRSSAYYHDALESLWTRDQERYRGSESLEENEKRLGSYTGPYQDLVSWALVGIAETKRGLSTNQRDIYIQHASSLRHNTAIAQRIASAKKSHVSAEETILDSERYEVPTISSRNQYDETRSRDSSNSRNG